MNRKLSVKTLFRSWAKTVFTFILIGAVTFGLFSQVAEYVNTKRIEKAKHLLRSTNIQVQNIAQNCGILDVNYFTKIFKKYTDKTPNEFRKG